jgi:basic membrane lipoprotein Med (substrate-binding protein (PBP1-ABC) superfamily)
LVAINRGGVVRVPSRKGWITIGAVVAVLVGIAILVWPGGRQLPPTRAREYRDVDACLLTGPSGITDSQSARVWAGLQDASAATRVRVSYLSVVGPETQANALPFVQSLVQKNCAVIVATGPVEVGAAAGVARNHQEIRFVLIGGARSSDNVVVVAAGDDVQSQVARTVRETLR